MKRKEPQNYSVLQKREEISKVKTLITTFQRGFRMFLSSQENFNTIRRTWLLRVPDCSFSPSVEHVAFHTQMVDFCFTANESEEQKKTLCTHCDYRGDSSGRVSSFSDEPTHRNQAVSRTINLKESKR